MTAAGGDFESIATVTVGSGGATSATFSNIPATYQHLQIRAIGQRASSVGGSYVGLRFNADSGSNYTRHQLDGNGSSAAARAGTSQSRANGLATTRHLPSNTTAQIFGAVVIDILDYASSTKNTTVRCLGGWDANGSGEIILNSSLWIDTDAITDIEVESGGDTWSQHTTFALYGIKAP